VAIPVPRLRAAAAGRPSTDPGCAGCGLLSALRALRRAGVELQGAIGCDGGGSGGLAGWPGRWAAVTGLAEIGRRGAREVLEEAWRAGAALVVVADRLAPARSLAPEEDLREAAQRVLRLDLADPFAAEARTREALETPRTVLVALAPCAREAPRGEPLRVETALCNRCGSCIGLGCPALLDPGEEGMVVDPAFCSGCALCASLCRSRAIGPAAPPRDGRP
jgi:ferredoxin